MDAIIEEGTAKTAESKWRVSLNELIGRHGAEGDCPPELIRAMLMERKEILGIEEDQGMCRIDFHPEFCAYKQRELFDPERMKTAAVYTLEAAEGPRHFYTEHAGGYSLAHQAARPLEGASRGMAAGVSGAELMPLLVSDYHFLKEKTRLFAPLTEAEAQQYLTAGGGSTAFHVTLNLAKNTVHIENLPDAAECNLPALALRLHGRGYTCDRLYEIASGPEACFASDENVEMDTKSTSRFARNAVDCLKTVRELKSLGVSIKFEKENIDTGLMSNELMLAFFSGAAQEESVSIAKNKRMGNRMHMKNGTYVASSTPFGYSLVENALVVDEGQATVVRRIFRDYLYGMNLREIADALTAEGIPKKNGETLWRMSSVAYILKNERYIGDALFQKTYATETLPFQQVRNKGELKRYYWQGMHEPIISRETWDRAQALLAQRGEQFINFQTGLEYPLSQKMTCGHCGASLRRKDRGNEVYWVCRNHDTKRDICPVMQIAESEIYRAFLRLYYKLRNNYRQILSPMAEQLQTLRLRQDMEDPELRKLSSQIQQLTKQSQMLHSLRAKGIFDSALFIIKSDELNHQLQELRTVKARLLDKDEDATAAKTVELVQLLESGPELLDAFDPELFADMVEGIIVESSERLRFRLHCGLELPESIERAVRG